MFGDPLDGNIIYIHLIAFDEVEQQVERTFKNLKLDLVVFHWALGARESALDRLALLLSAVFVAILFASFELADLAGKFVDHFVDGHIEIGLGIFRVDIRSSEGKVDFHGVGLFPVVIVKQNNMCGDDLLTMAFKVADFFGDKFVDGTSEG